jgi:hypothetical protein
MAKEKATRVESEAVGFRYICKTTCFFEGKRVFAGQAVTRTEKLPKAQATFFREPQILTQNVEVEAEDGED